MDLAVRANKIDPRNMSHKYEALEQDQKKLDQNAEVSTSCSGLSMRTDY